MVLRISILFSIILIFLILPLSLIFTQSEPNKDNKVDLSPFLPTAGNQGKQISSAAWAVAYYKTFQENREEDWYIQTDEHTFSPAYIYNSINGGKDSGCYLEDALSLICEKGCCSLEAMPYNENNYYITPDVWQNVSAARYRSKSWNDINFKDISLLKDHLKLNKDCFVIAVLADDIFLNLRGESVWNKQGTKIAGYYGLLVTGYDDTVGKTGAFRVLNSRGTSWGDNGYAWITYELLPQICKGAFVLVDAPNIDVKEIDVPKNMSATNGKHLDYVEVVWDKVDEADGYNVYRSDKEDGHFVYVKSVCNNHFYDYTELSGETNPYFYKVMSFSLDGESDLSEAVSGYRIKNNFIK